jgi:hypothetical protein
MLFLVLVGGIGNAKNDMTACLAPPGATNVKQYGLGWYGFEFQGMRFMAHYTGSITQVTGPIDELEAAKETLKQIDKERKKNWIPGSSYVNASHGVKNESK